MALRRLLPLVEIILMVILGRVEDHSLSDLRCGMITHLHQLAKYFDSDVALLSVVKPDGRQILCADVDALSVDLLEIVDFEEVFDQSFV